MAEYEPLYRPGKSITRQASAAITGGQLVVVSGSGTVAPSSTATPSWVGVAGFDVTSGQQVVVYSEGVQRIAGAAAITAGTIVEAAANGQVAAHTNGTNDINIVGLALNTTTAAGQLVEVDVFH